MRLVDVGLPGYLLHYFVAPRCTLLSVTCFVVCLMRMYMY